MTLSSLALLSVVVAHLSPSKSGISRFSRPFVTTVVQQEQLLTLASATPAHGWSARLVHWAAEIPATPLPTAAQAFADALSRDAGSASPTVAVALQARRAVVLTALGRHSEARKALEDAAGAAPAGAVVSRVIGYALLGAAEVVGSDEVDQAVAALHFEGLAAESWTADQIKAAFFDRAGRPERAAAVRSALRDRADGLMVRVSLPTLVSLAPVAMGLLLLLAGVFLQSRFMQSRDAAVLPAPWSVGTGYAVAVRTVALGVLAALGLELVMSRLGPAGSPAALSPITNLLVTVAYFEIGLLRPRGLSLLPVFGLRRGNRLPALAAFTVVLFAVRQLLGWGGGAAFAYLDQQPLWTEIVNEPLLTGAAGERWLATFSYIVAAPIAEELFFRGLIYGTLRSRMGVWLSAGISAALFSLSHGYSLVNGSAVFVGALVSALIYEKSRSLLPCILSHAAHNTIVVVSALLLAPR